MRHAHPITIVANLWRVLYLLIIPVVRGFFFALQGNLANWLGSAWIDILLLLSMLAFSVLRWRSVRFSCDRDALDIRSGLLWQRHTLIPWRNIVTLSVVRSFYLKPFRAVRLRADTPGGSFQSADFSILLSPEAARDILSHGGGKPDRNAHTYSPGTGSILSLALLTSNSFAGVVFLSTFVSQSGKLLGNEFSQLLIGTVENAARTLAFGIPPAAAAIAYVLLAGWFAGFLLTFLRYKNFSAVRGDDALHLSGGLFTGREYRIRRDDINFMDIRQSVTTKILKLYSLYISAVGYGKNKDDISCIVPTEGTAKFERSREALFPELKPAPRTLRPHWNGLMRFIGEPLFYCAAVLFAAFLSACLFPGWSNFILFAGLMLLIPTIFFLLVRCFDFRSSGISYCDGHYTLRYSQRFSLHIVVIPADKIVLMELRQSFLQRFGKNCDLFVHTKAEGQALHRCRSLDKAALAKLLRISAARK